MKIMSEWLEGVIETLDSEKRKASVFLLVLLVLVIGAGSLYMLLNSPS
jgi:flagellar basal body-associated protein FliL